MYYMETITHHFKFLIYQKLSGGLLTGDIVKATNYPFYSEGNLNYLGIVCYCNQSCSYFIVYQRISTHVSGRAVSASFEEFNDNELEVLGNVYENPELLELKNE